MKGRFIVDKKDIDSLQFLIFNREIGEWNAMKLHTHYNKKDRIYISFSHM